MKIIGLLLLLATNIALAVPLTLDKYISDNPTWNSADKKSLSYITSRCGVLFSVISNNQKDKSDTQEMANTAFTDAKKFFSISSDIYKTSCINYECIKLEKKAAQAREKKWSAIYKEAAKHNIKIYGEMLHGDIKSDFLACSSKVKPVI